jgi:hypothetical protein
MAHAFPCWGPFRLAQGARCPVNHLTELVEASVDNRFRSVDLGMGLTELGQLGI